MSRFFASRSSVAADAYYGLINGQNGDGVYAIGAFTRAADAYSEYSGNPVLQKGSSGAWDDGHVKDPMLVWDGSQYVMFYSGYDGATYRIGRATAPSHEGPWTKYVSNPVLDLGSGGSWDDAGVTFPTVLYEPTDTGREWKMWYIGNDGSGFTKIGYAYSSDGITWTKYASNPVITYSGTVGAWDRYSVAIGAVLQESGTYNLFISGRKGTTNPQWQGGLYTCTDPEGTYTVYGSNPIMIHRVADANTSPTVTGSATITLGATTVPITVPAAFNVGEPVMLIDGNSAVGPEVFYVTAIGASDVTLNRGVGATYTASTVFRSFALNAIGPRTVLAKPSGGYEAFCTPFQPVEDLNLPVGETKLYEGTIEMTASALTGPWSYRYVAGRGLVFPLRPSGASWHTRSAENPSVIAAP